MKHKIRTCKGASRSFPWRQVLLHPCACPLENIKLIIHSHVHIFAIFSILIIKFDLNSPPRFPLINNTAIQMQQPLVSTRSNTTCWYGSPFYNRQVQLEYTRPEYQRMAPSAVSSWSKSTSKVGAKMHPTQENSARRSPNSFTILYMNRLKQSPTTAPLASIREWPGTTLLSIPLLFLGCCY